MSLEALPNSAIRPTNYQHLYKLYALNDLTVQKESLNGLTEGFRKKIFYNICEQAGRSDVADYRKTHVFDSTPRLQQAVKKIATDVLSSLGKDQQAEIMRKISEHHGRTSSKDGNWGEIDPTGDVPLLLETMHNSLGDLTPELQTILDEWVEKSARSENRERAKSIIINFLKDRQKTTIVLNELGLTSLPDIFDKEPFTSRLTRLFLFGNLLTALPKGIGRLQRLQLLNLSGNYLKKFPKGIGKLKHLECLGLANNYLKKFPKEISGLESLRMLDLANNHLKELPKQISGLKSLKMLDLSHNNITWIHEKIGDLQSLECLKLYKNHLKKLPKEIRGLKSLKTLNLSLNQFRKIRKEIGHLQSLEFLDLSTNSLAELPKEIGNLQSLRYLILYENSLVIIPQEIGNLHNLTQLCLSNNPGPNLLTNGLLRLTQDCTVDLGVTEISADDIRKLRRLNHVENHQGPIFLPFERWRQQHLPGEPKPLPTLIKELFSVLEKESKSFPELEKLATTDKDSLQAWLSRLFYTLGSQDTKGLLKELVRKIVDYLQEANDNPTFRETFLKIIEEASSSCGDRVILSVLDLGIALRLRQITDIAELKRFLIGTIWPLEMLAQRARTKIRSLYPALNPEDVEEIEIYLGYRIKLQERLNLGIAAHEMLYYPCSRLTDEDLNLAADYVENQQKNQDAVRTFLSSREDWKNALETQYPDEYARIVQENEEELETVNETEGDFHQLQFNEKQRWEDLTARALREIALREMNQAAL